jgi:hypothetical protein
VFQGKTIDELIAMVLMAELSAKQHAGSPHAGEVEDGSLNESQTDHFLLGAA